LSRILVLLYCKLFLATLEVNAPVEENEPLTEDTSAYFTVVLRRCLVACRIPWHKRSAADENPDAESGAVGGGGGGDAEASSSAAPANGAEIPAAEESGAAVDLEAQPDPSLAVEAAGPSAPMTPLDAVMQDAEAHFSASNAISHPSPMNIANMCESVDGNATESVE
ncbi:hypothetical protein HDU98_011113, partial [Podochytrium sp. JEL0797]